jgi:hypothetical protein
MSKSRNKPSAAVITAKKEDAVETVPEIPGVDEQELIKKFVDAYNDLCKKHGYRFEAKPDWLPTNHNSYELVTQMVIIKA